MLSRLKRALARRRAVRAKAAELVRLFGAQAADVASLNAIRVGSEDEYTFWEDVSRFARWWHAHLAALDPATRCTEVDRYARQRPARLQEQARNAARALLAAVQARPSGQMVDAGDGLQDPQSK